MAGLAQMMNFRVWCRNDLTRSGYTCRPDPDKSVSIGFWH